MKSLDWMQLAVFFVALIGLTPLLGGWMARVYADEKHLLQRPLGWLEKLFYRYAECDPKEEMDWRRYAAALLWFNLIGFAVVFAVTAASYGLPQAQAHTRVTGHGNSQHSSPAKADAQKQQQR